MLKIEKTQEAREQMIAKQIEQLSVRVTDAQTRGSLEVNISSHDEKWCDEAIAAVKQALRHEKFYEVCYDKGLYTLSWKISKPLLSEETWTGLVYFTGIVVLALAAFGVILGYDYCRGVLHYDIDEGVVVTVEKPDGDLQ